MLKTIDLSRAVLVPKATKVEYDMLRLKLTRRQLASYYRNENAAVIFASHERQLAMRRRVLKLLPEARVVSRQALDPAALEGASLVVALGGDNHFIFVSQLLDATPILGVNADRLRSYGGLLHIDETNLESALRRMRAGGQTCRRLARIQASVDGRPVGRATSEIFVGERGRKNMSRHALSMDGGAEEEQKSSGLLIATAAGSTGWFSYYARPFSQGARYGRWALSEAFPREARYERAEGKLWPGQTLTVRSLNDSEGIVSIDCLRDVPLAFCAVATFRMSEQPLMVLRPEA